jgi:hypothetical protein
MKKLLQVSLVIGINLAVQSVLSIPASAQIKTEPNRTQPEAPSSKANEFTFDFNNTYDYNACLDVILLAYEKRNAVLENVYKNDCATNVLNTFGSDLSKDVALQLVESANSYATEELENPLYPTLGVRRRIAINLGYVYDTDKNNPDILKYVDSESQVAPLN